MKKTKIICTLGPASQNLKTLTEMVHAGMNVARLNFSHGDHENHSLLINNIRRISSKTGVPIAIIQDLHGPKIRVANLQETISVKVGDKLVIGKDFKLDTEVARSLKPKQRILIEDGLIELEVIKVSGKMIDCAVLSPGRIQNHKGVNLPRTRLKIPILTERDIEDLQFGLKNDVDYIALSFVRTARDIAKLKRLIAKYNPKGFMAPKIIAKIEKPEAVKNFNAILRESDAIMVARGDLGVEMPESQVPIIQKEIIQKCLRAAKPVIVATQMLDSMIRNPRPTRAEVSDVANAVIDQADCVMLSGESAFGKFPVKAVSEMNKIIIATEKSHFLPKHPIAGKSMSKVEALAEGVYDLAERTQAKVIVGATESGFTAREIAHERPYNTHLIMLTPDQKARRQMSMVWGVESFLMPKVKTLEQLISKMLAFVKQKRFARRGDRIIIVTGEPLGQRENLNLVEVRTI
ncbi:MAG: pyruvate kinase [Candidatus Doudnabacteria bacterium]|nr:pyruvate kinase [Candidatus Doudnabacteria bacterium]